MENEIFILNEFNVLKNKGGNIQEIKEYLLNKYDGNLDYINNLINN